MDSPGESGPRSLPGPARPSLARGYSSGIGPHPGPRGQRWLESAPASLTPQGVGVRREEGSPLGDIGCLVQRLLGAILSLLLPLPHTQTRSCSRVAGTVRGSRVARSGGDVGSLGSRGSACGVSVLETAEPQSFPAERGRGAAVPSRLSPPPAGRGCPLPRRRLAGGAGHGPVWSIQVPPPVCGGPSPSPFLSVLLLSAALAGPQAPGRGEWRQRVRQGAVSAWVQGGWVQTGESCFSTTFQTAEPGRRLRGIVKVTQPVSELSLGPTTLILKHYPDVSARSKSASPRGWPGKALES